MKLIEPFIVSTHAIERCHERHNGQQQLTGGTIIGMIRRIFSNNEPWIKFADGGFWLRGKDDLIDDDLVLCCKRSGNTTIIKTILSVEQALSKMQSNGKAR